VAFLHARAVSGYFRRELPVPGATWDRIRLDDLAQRSGSGWTTTSRRVRAERPWRVRGRASAVWWPLDDHHDHALRAPRTRGEGGRGRSARLIGQREHGANKAKRPATRWATGRFSRENWRGGRDSNVIAHLRDSLCGTRPCQSTPRSDSVMSVPDRSVQYRDIPRQSPTLRPTDGTKIGAGWSKMYRLE
jgi:hypothetical protein